MDNQCPTISSNPNLNLRLHGGLYRKIDWREYFPYFDPQRYNNVQFFIIQQCNLNDNELFHIFQTEWPQLEYLSLIQNKITEIGVQGLMQDKFPKLIQLELNRNSIGNIGFKLLIKQIKNLQILIVKNCKLTSSFARELCDTQVVGLRQLNIGNNNIGSQGVQLLCRINFPNLQTLGLNKIDSSLINNKGCKIISKIQWPRLQRLYLECQSIQFDGHLALTLVHWSNQRGGQITLQQNGYGLSSCYFSIECKLKIAENFKRNLPLQKLIIRSTVAKILMNKYVNPYHLFATLRFDN